MNPTNSTSTHKHNENYAEYICYYGTEKEEPVKNFDIKTVKQKKSYYKFSTPYLIVEILMTVPKNCHKPTAAHVVAIRVNGLIFEDEKDTIKNLFPKNTLTINRCSPECLSPYRFAFQDTFNDEATRYKQLIECITNRLSETHREIFLTSVKGFTMPKGNHDYLIQKKETSKKTYLKPLVNELLTYPPSLMLYDSITMLYRRDQNRSIRSHEERLREFFHRAACDKHIDEAIRLLEQAKCDAIDKPVEGRRCDQKNTQPKQYRNSRQTEQATQWRSQKALNPEHQQPPQLTFSHVS